MNIKRENAWNLCGTKENRTPSKYRLKPLSEMRIIISYVRSFITVLVDWPPSAPLLSRTSSERLLSSGFGMRPVLFPRKEPSSM